MEEIVPVSAFSPEVKEELREAFELGRLFAEKSPEQFSEILKSRKAAAGVSLRWEDKK